MERTCLNRSVVTLVAAVAWMLSSAAGAGTDRDIFYTH